MTTNDSPEPRKGSAPGQSGDLAGRSDAETAGQAGWLDAETADRLLEAGLDTPHSDQRVADLARLLATAVEEADSRPHSMNAERLAVQAFLDTRSAGRRPAGSERRRARWRNVSRPTKALVGGIAAVSVLSGVAIAAQTGTLPHPFHSGGGAPVESHSAPPATPSPSTSRGAGAGRPTISPNSTASNAPAAPSTHPSAPGASTPAPPSLKGLCTSYERASQRGEHLNSTAQLRLESAAGGPAEVASYCAHLIGGQTSGHGKAATSTPSEGLTATTPQTPAPHAPRPAAPVVVAGPTTGHGHA